MQLPRFAKGHSAMTLPRFLSLFGKVTPYASNSQNRGSLWFLFRAELVAKACLGYWFGSGTDDLIAGMAHGPTLQAHGWAHGLWQDRQITHAGQVVCVQNPQSRPSPSATNVVLHRGFDFVPFRPILVDRLRRSCCSCTS